MKLEATSVCPPVNESAVYDVFGGELCASV